MSINFPTSLDTLTNPVASDSTVTVPHASQHANANDILESLEAKVGINSSAVTTSHDYKLSGVTGSDKAASKAGSEVLTNKTLTSPVIKDGSNNTMTLPTGADTLVARTSSDTMTNKTLTSPVINVTSDATGDTYYRNSGGLFTRLGIGSTNNVLAVTAGIPSWVAATSVITGKFGGTGADGALAITTGTTTIDCSNANIVVKNYTSISITGDGKLAFSNPATTGTLIILKSQGAVTLTSSDTAMIDASGMGAAAATDGYVMDASSHKGVVNTTTTGGAGGSAFPAYAQYSTSANIISANKKITMGVGSGGGTANGGRGGGALYIECGGAFNFTTGGIKTNGLAGTANLGGGGGSAGTCTILYSSLTANSGTILTTGGNGATGPADGFTGGAGGAGGTGGGGGGGGAGGESSSAGGGGGAGSVTAGGTGGNAAGGAGSAGGAGTGYYVGLNTEFF